MKVRTPHPWVRRQGDSLLKKYLNSRQESLPPSPLAKAQNPTQQKAVMEVPRIGCHRMARLRKISYKKMRRLRMKRKMRSMTMIMRRSRSMRRKKNIAKTKRSSIRRQINKSCNLTQQTMPITQRKTIQRPPAIS